MHYTSQLTAYARRTLKELYAFAALNPTQKNFALKNQLAELLAFASDDQLNEIAKRLNRHSDAANFIEEEHGVWSISPNNPTYLHSKKREPRQPKVPAQKIATRRIFFRKK